MFAVIICPHEPLHGNYTAAFRALGADGQIEVEEIARHWRKPGPDEGERLLKYNHRYHLLLKRIYGTQKMLVANHDLNSDTIEILGIVGKRRAENDATNLATNLASLRMGQLNQKIKNRRWSG